MNASIVYFFSSAPKDRPEYRRGILDVLCYPNGHQLELSYQRKHIHPDLRDCTESLVNRDALFVFADYKKPDIDFLAVRYARILRVSTKQEAAQFEDTSRLFFRILLGELVDHDNSVSSRIQAIPGRPVYHNLNPGVEYYYVLEHRNVCTMHYRHGPRDRWELLAIEAGKATSLANCIFLQTGTLREFKTNVDCAFGPYGDRGDLAYKIRPNNIFMTDLRIYCPSSVSSGQEIFIRSSSDLLVISQAFPTAIGGTSDHEAFVTCKRSIEDTLATLVFDVRSPVTVPGAQPVSPAVMCAKPQYLLSIGVTRGLVLQFIACVFAGVLLSGMSAEFFKEWSGLKEWRNSLGLLAKIAGAVFLARAAYLGFRKLPSGGPAG